MSKDYIYTCLQMAESNGAERIFGSEAKDICRFLSSLLSKTEAEVPIKTDYKGFDGRPIFKCPHCKNEIIDHTSHCVHCGKALKWGKFENS